VTIFGISIFIKSLMSENTPNQQYNTSDARLANPELFRALANGTVVLLPSGTLSEIAATPAAPQTRSAQYYTQLLQQTSQRVLQPIHVQLAQQLIERTDDVVRMEIEPAD
jgi:hypothetical protein